MKRKAAQHWLEYAFFRAFEIAVHGLPGPVLEALAGLLTFLIFDVIRYRRRVALDNLAHAFPEKSLRERERIARAAARHFALLLLEFMKLSGWDAATLQRKARFEMDAETRDILENRSKTGGIMVSGHFGNWEVAIAMMASQYWGAPVVVQKRQKNRWVDRKTIDMRERWGVRMVYARGAVRALLQALRERRMVVLLADQDAGRNGAFVPFLNRIASTPVGPAVLHLRSGKPLYFGANLRVGRYRYKIIVREIDYSGPAEISSENIAAVTAGYTALLEELVRLYPEQYLWMHKRWKTRPEDVAASVAAKNG